MAAASSAYVPASTRPPAAPQDHDRAQFQQPIPSELRSHGAGQANQDGGNEGPAELCQRTSVWKHRMAEYAQWIVDAVDGYHGLLDGKHLNEYIEEHHEVKGGSSTETYDMINRSSDFDPSILKTFENLHTFGADQLSSIDSANLLKHFQSKAALESAFPKLYDLLTLRRCNALQSIMGVLDFSLPFFPIRRRCNPQLIPVRPRSQWLRLLNRLAEILKCSVQRIHDDDDEVTNAVVAATELLSSTDDVRPLGFLVDNITEGDAQFFWRHLLVSSATATSSEHDAVNAINAVDKNLETMWSATVEGNFVEWSCTLGTPSDIDGIEIVPASEKQYLAQRYDVFAKKSSGERFSLGSTEGTSDRSFWVRGTKEEVSDVIIRLYPFPTSDMQGER